MDLTTAEVARKHGLSNKDFGWHNLEAALKEYGAQEAKSYASWLGNQVIAGRTSHKLWLDYTAEVLDQVTPCPAPASPAPLSATKLAAYGYEGDEVPASPFYTSPGGAAKALSPDLQQYADSLDEVLAAGKEVEQDLKEARAGKDVGLREMAYMRAFNHSDYHYPRLLLLAQALLSGATPSAATLTGEGAANFFPIQAGSLPTEQRFVILYSEPDTWHELARLQTRNFEVPEGALYWELRNEVVRVDTDSEQPYWTHWAYAPEFGRPAPAAPVVVQGADADSFSRAERVLHEQAAKGMGVGLGADGTKQLSETIKALRAAAPSSGVEVGAAADTVLTLKGSRWLFVADTPEVKQQVNDLLATVGLAIPADTQGPRYKYVLWNSDKVDALYSDWSKPRWGYTVINWEQFVALITTGSVALPASPTTSEGAAANDGKEQGDE